MRQNSALLRALTIATALLLAAVAGWPSTVLAASTRHQHYAARHHHAYDSYPYSTRAAYGAMIGGSSYGGYPGYGYGYGDNSNSYAQ